MALRNSKEEYGSVAKFFHWFIGISIVLLLIVGFLMGYTPKGYTMVVYNLHKSLGIIILFLAVLRLLWKAMNPRLNPPTESGFQNAAALCVHGALYLAMLGMPLSGWVMSTASGHIPKFLWVYDFPMPFIAHNVELAGQANQVHEYLAYGIIALLVAHIGAALYHHIVVKDNVLARMLPTKNSQK